MISNRGWALIAFVVVLIFSTNLIGVHTKQFSSLFHVYVVWALGFSSALAWASSAILSMEGAGAAATNKETLYRWSNWANFIAALLTGATANMQLYSYS